MGDISWRACHNFSCLSGFCILFAFFVASSLASSCFLSCFHTDCFKSKIFILYFIFYILSNLIYIWFLQKKQKNNQTKTQTQTVLCNFCSASRIQRGASSLLDRSLSPSVLLPLPYLATTRSLVVVVNSFISNLFENLFRWIWNW